MLSKILRRGNLAKALGSQTAATKQLVGCSSQRAFSHGPYNPLHYKTVLVSEEMPS